MAPADAHDDLLDIGRSQAGLLDRARDIDLQFLHMGARIGLYNGSRPTMPTVEPNEVSITNVQPMNPPSRKASRECTSRSLWAHGLLQVERGPSLADWDECDGTSAVAGEFAV